MPQLGTPVASKVILSTAGRVLGAVGMGYVFSAACVGLGAVALAALGWPRSEAVVLAAMLGFVLFLCVLLWAFSVTSVWRMWLVLSLGSAAAVAVLRWV